MSDLIVDLFAGPGGWDEALSLMNLRALGLEWDSAACRTRAAANHPTIQCDVSAYPVEPFRGKTTGLAGSPPCTKFTAAGKGFGRLVLDVLADGIRRMMRGDDCRAELRDRIYPIALAEQEKANAERKPEKRWTQAAVEAAAREDTFTTVLVLEPARYLYALIIARSPDTPFEWAAFEQVREVLPLWKVYATELRRLGWSVWCGILNAANYGVPQTRRRAILIASCVRSVTAPPPTHTQHPMGDDLFGDSLHRWVSMAEALGWDNDVVVNTRGDRKTPGGNDFSAEGPSWALTEKTRSWVLRTSFGQPSSDSGHHEMDPYTRPAHVVTTKARNWVLERPATTVCATNRIAPPGHRDRSSDGESQFASPETVQVTAQEAALLQSFRGDYPWQGTRTKVFEQIGNAVPPFLAVHVVAAATGLPLPAHIRQEAAA